MKVLFVFGTRPEAIKMVPVIRTMQMRSEFTAKVCVTAQHREMLDQVLQFFEVAPDFDLNLMKPGQSLFDITATALKGLEGVIRSFQPDVVVVQGDTTTALVGALAAFYCRVKVAHIEAGLRSHNKLSPFPEEMNRILAGHIADYHFAPTDGAAQNLKNEGIHANIWVVGNTVIDALHLGLKIIEKHGDIEYREHFRFLDPAKRMILVTGHRRESFGQPFEHICYALKSIADRHKDVEIVYPVHLNPSVIEPVHRLIGGHDRIHLIEPLSYPHMLWLMNLAYFVITDSGGIQEEAPALGKPVLVTREVTERMEGIMAGTARLVGTNMESIISQAETLLTDRFEYEAMARAVNPYGDGKASERIIGILVGQINAEY